MIKKIFQEPLTHFVLIGGAIFFIYNVMNGDSDTSSGDNIVIADSDIDRIVEIYERTWSQSPDDETLQALVQSHVDQEIMYLEGLKLNLDHNDEIIKRRLVQKYEFLVKDLSTADVATDDDLKAFYQDYKGRYQSPNKVSFHHFYFSPDRHDNPKELASKAIENWRTSQIEKAQYSDDSDAFFISSPQQSQTKDQLWQNFGKKFGDELMQVSDIGWYGPIESGLGWHVLYIDDIEPPQQVSFDQVKIDVERDYKEQQLIDYNQKIIESLRADYNVQYDLSRWEKSGL